MQMTKPKATARVVVYDLINGGSTSTTVYDAPAVQVMDKIRGLDAGGAGVVAPVMSSSNRRRRPRSIPSS
jgi:hypothetical protein